MPEKTASLRVLHGGNRKYIVGILGFFLSFFGILCGMFFEPIFNIIMEKELVLRPDSRIYEKWKRPPVALNLDLYLFNWTNPEDFSNFSTKPILQQCGPYRFREFPEKVDINWHPENASLTYRRKSDFFFDAENSAGTLDDEIITLNAVALSAATKAKNWGSVRRNLVDVGLKMYGQEMSVMKTVDELLFSGYSDDMLDMARAMPIFGKDVEVPFDRFGWFYTRNGSADLTGYFNVFTGADDISKIGQMHTWNFKTHSGFYDSHCGLVSGSGGEFHPPNLQINGSVSLFTPDLCRPVPLDFVNTEEIEGVLGYKFAAGPRSIDNGTLYPENLCFCGGKCVPSGVMNISACRFGSPVFMSYPHFYNADPYFLNQVEGLNPKQADHEFYLTLEPRLSLPLEVAARFQVNMLVEPIEGISLYEGIPRVFMPLIWFEQKVRIPPELAREVRMLPMILTAGQIFACVCFGVGLIMLCWYPIELLWARHRTVELKIQATTDSIKKRSAFTSSEELKPPSINNTNKSPDSSPLLQGVGKSVKMLPKSETNDRAATVTTANSTNVNE